MMINIIEWENLRLIHEEVLEALNIEIKVMLSKRLLTMYLIILGHKKLCVYFVGK